MPSFDGALPRKLHAELAYLVKLRHKDNCQRLITGQSCDC